MNIETIQRELQKAGYYRGSIDGDWGPMTMKAFLMRAKDRAEVIPVALRIAAGDLHIKEFRGDKTAPRIAEYHQHTSLKAKADEVAWCSSAMNCWWNEAGFTGTNSAAARSWLGWGKTVKIPQLGDVAIFLRGTSSWQGHVAFYIIGDGETILHLGGNQSDAVTVAATPISKLLGYRRGPNA